MYNISIPPFFE